MREDMARVIVERPRIKSYGDRKGRRLKIDDLPTREGMRRARAERGNESSSTKILRPAPLSGEAGRTPVG